MNNVRLHMSIDEVARESMDNLPRAIGVSKIMRFILKASFMSQKQVWDYIEHDKEAKQVAEFLRKNLVGKLGL
jgi:hypothetical protein